MDSEFGVLVCFLEFLMSWFAWWEIERLKLSDLVSSCDGKFLLKIDMACAFGSGLLYWLWLIVILKGRLRTRGLIKLKGLRVLSVLPRLDSIGSTEFKWGHYSVSCVVLADLIQHLRLIFNFLSLNLKSPSEILKPFDWRLRVFSKGWLGSYFRVSNVRLKCALFDLSLSLLDISLLYVEVFQLLLSLAGVETLNEILLSSLHFLSWQLPSLLIIRLKTAFLQLIGSL